MTMYKSGKVLSINQVKIGAILSYSLIFFNIVTSVLYTPWMLSAIGKSQYGLYTLAITIISFFTIDFGIGEAVSRFLAKYVIENDESNYRNFLGITLKLYIVIDVIILIGYVIIYMFADKIYLELTTEELIKFKRVFLIVASYSVLSFIFTPVKGILIAHERFVFQKSTKLIAKIINVILIIIMLNLGYKLFALVLVNLFTEALILATNVIYVMKEKLLKININSKNKNLYKSLFSFSLWTTIIAISQRLIENITPTILAAVSGSIEISIFSIASSIHGYIWTFAHALNGLFLPMVTKLTKDNDSNKKIENLMIKVGRIQLMIVGLLIVGFITMGQEFINIWLGQDFVESYYVAIFLILPNIITLTQEIGTTALIAQNKVKYKAISLMITAIISFSISLVLSSYFGALGSAIAIFTGNLIGQILVLNYIYSKELKINLLKFYLNVQIKMLVPFILVYIVGYVMQHYLPHTSLFVFLIKVAILSVFYVILFWITVLNKSEKQLILTPLTKLFNKKSW